MESSADPLNLTLKEEQKRGEIQELEDGAIDMQKVQVCSEGVWVSEPEWDPA